MVEFCGKLLLDTSLHLLSEDMYDSVSLPQGRGFKSSWGEPGGPCKPTSLMHLV